MSNLYMCVVAAGTVVNSFDYCAFLNLGGGGEN